jgi:tellurite resistance protein TehA-like permease
VCTVLGVRRWRVKRSKGRSKASATDSLTALKTLKGNDLKEACIECLNEVRTMSSALTAQVLTLLPMQALLAAGLGFAIQKNPNKGYWVNLVAVGLLGLAVMCGVFALSRMHYRTFWDLADDTQRRAFVGREARRVADKGWWAMAEIGTTVLAALAVAAAGLLALRA